MPIFGDYETYGEPLAITEDRGHVSTVWRARKAGDQGDPRFAVKCYAPHRRQSSGGKPEDALDKDPAQEFLAGIKQLQKAYNEGGRGLVPIHDLGFSDEGAWYVTDYYPRNTLKAWIARRGGVDSAALRQVVSGIVSGCLALKRSRGYPHGNLKAANIFLVGKPRPLRSTPLHLADAFPSAPLQLAKLGKDDRREADALLHQVMEAQDLRALGELLLQLVEGRLVNSAYDYNYPIASSPAWENLGRDGERWRDLCNRLLDPQLSLDKLSLESLAKEYKPGGMSPHMPKILAGVGAVCVIAVGVYFGLQLVNRGRGERQKADQAKLVSLIAESKTALDKKDFETAISTLEEALRLKPELPEATALRKQAEEKLAAAYQDEMGRAKAAMAAEKYEEAEQNASRALQLRKNDKTAGDLVKAAQTRRAARMTQAEQAAKYDQAMAAGRAAYDRKDFDGALKQADEALRYKSGDAAAATLKSEVQLQLNAVRSVQEKEKKYQAAMSAGRTAMTKKDFDGAVSQAEQALSYKTGDAAAMTLKKDAQVQLDVAKSAQEKEQKYQAAMAAGRAALNKKDFDGAMKEAEEALRYKSGDPAATTFKNDVQAQLGAIKLAQEKEQKYQAAMTAGRAALEKKDYDGAARQAEEALKNKTGDSAATMLQKQALELSDAAKGEQEKEQKYQAAMTAGRSALSRKDYEDALKQADEALRYKSGDASAATIKKDAQTQLDVLRLAQEKEQKYQAAMAAGREANDKKDYDGAMKQADEALRIRTGDAAATALKRLAQEQLDAVKLAQEKEQKYQVAMTAGRAAMERKDYDGAKTQAAEALRNKSGDSAATTLQKEAEREIQAAKREQDFQNAKTSLTQGNYLAALDLVSKHESSDPKFEVLSRAIKAEQSVFLSATNKYSQGDYSFIAEVDSGEYKNNIQFAGLLGGGKSEQADLLRLSALTNQPTGWQTMPGELKKLRVAVLSKKPFRDLEAWAKGKADEVQRAKQQEIAKLDVRLEDLRKLFGEPRPKWLNGVPISSLDEVGTSIALPVQEQYLREVGLLENEYAKNNLLDKERQNFLKKLKSNIAGR